MKLKFALFGMLVAMLTGCSSDDDVLSVNEPLTEEGVCEVVTSQNVKAIAKYIGRHHHTVSRSAENLLSPYVVDGDTVMYIANYGEGWEVFSNDPRVPMVLMKSDIGNFYPTALDNESPFDALFQNTAQYLSSVKNEDFAPTDTINSEWMAYGIKPLENDWGEKDPDDNNDGYHWKLVWNAPHKDYHEVYMPTGGRLVTKWRQGFYFNSFTPFKGADHASLGCTAVAIGQYLYFTHYKDNRPEKTVTNAVYNKNNSYTFSGSSSTIWNSFVEYNTYDSIAMEPTAIFLGWVAQSIGTKFGESSSSAGLKNVTLPFFNDQTQLGASVKEYKSYLVTDVLEKGYPVFIRADAGTEYSGHAWLIDYCESEGYIEQSYYVYIKSSGESTDEDEDMDADFFEDNTIEKIKEVYGDNVEIDVRTYSRNKSFLKCNWGWGGWYDNVEFDANIPSWVVDEYIFNKNHKIYYF